MAYKHICTDFKNSDIFLQLAQQKKKNKKKKTNINLMA